MKIFHRDTNQVFDDIELFLTPAEASEIAGKLEGLIENPKLHHFHVVSEERNGVFQKELTVAIYTNDNLNDFDERSKELISFDK